MRILYPTPKVRIKEFVILMAITVMINWNWDVGNEIEYFWTKGNDNKIKYIYKENETKIPAGPE